MIYFVKAYKLQKPKSISMFARKRLCERAKRLNAWNCSDFAFDRKQQWFRKMIKDEVKSNILGQLSVERVAL